MKVYITRYITELNYYLIKPLEDITQKVGQVCLLRRLAVIERSRVQIFPMAVFIIFAIFETLAFWQF